MENLIAPCGIDCTQCDAYIATQSNDEAIMSKMADAFEKKFNKRIEPENLKCDGCMAEGRHIGFCAQCGIRQCASDKGYITCAECDSFPCETGSFIWVEGSKSKATLEMLKSNSH